MGQVIASRGGDLISFAAGYPDPMGFPWNEFREIANELLSGDDGSVLQYGPTRGYKPLLESIQGVLEKRGINADLREVMTTSGSQQGLDLTARVLIAPGDVVLVEVPDVYRRHRRVPQRAVPPCRRASRMPTASTSTISTPR
jgi:DNA-binding transcriptional MocR family regulator